MFGNTNQKVALLTSKYSHTISSCFLSITLVISASCFHLNTFTNASTLSQSKAPFLF
ncbi:MAG: hypothetical protein Q8S84_07045 [bacterium]|nr:hypothetical protein [bacterium]MDP3381212.1 hypothetical protein [bacterium]